MRLLVALALVLVACTGPRDGATESPSPSPTATGTVSTPTSAADALGRTCLLPAGELEIEVPYPTAWHTNSPEPAGDGVTVPPCRVFHHEPFDLPRANELTGYDVFVKVEDVAYRHVAADDDPTSEVLERRETLVDGRPAVARERRASEDGMAGPAGSRHYTYAVDLGDDRSLVLATYEVAGLDYEGNREVLDAVAGALRIRSGPAITPPR